MLYESLRAPGPGKFRHLCAIFMSPMSPMSLMSPMKITTICETLFPPVLELQASD